MSIPSGKVVYVGLCVLLLVNVFSVFTWSTDNKKHMNVMQPRTISSYTTSNEKRHLKWIYPGLTHLSKILSGAPFMTRRWPEGLSSTSWTESWERGEACWGHDTCAWSLGIFIHFLGLFWWEIKVVAGSTLWVVCIPCVVGAFIDCLACIPVVLPAPLTHTRTPPGNLYLSHSISNLRKAEQNCFPPSPTHAFLF